ncbi:ABC-three component system middle component 1 [Clostridium cagae]|uniref:ABC-three component system middle component 1 n=1 Tax=Clostridium cagae TaxID=2080751 RepID=UPI003F771BFD
MLDIIFKLWTEFEEDTIRIKKLEELKYKIMLGKNKKWYLFYDSMKEFNSDTILDNIEKIYLEDDDLKRIAPQFLYVIVLANVNRIDENVYKEIIKVEENEYFCKKYVLYYSNDELNNLQNWLERNKKSDINQLINQDDNIELMNLSNDNADKIAFKLLLRIIIKCPFINVKFINKGLEDFKDRINQNIDAIRKKNIKSLIYKYRDNIFDKINESNLDEMADKYINMMRKEEI